MPLQQNDRLCWLDAARGFAALTVLTAHTLDHLWKGYAQFVQFGNAGVVLFFLISGYIIPVSLERTTISRFWLRRAFRLYPLYWCSLILYLLFGMTTVTMPWDVFANLTMVQPYLGIAHVSNLYWSLTVELTFYGLLTLLVIVGLHKATIPVILILAALFLILANLGARWVLDLNLIYLPICFGGTLWYRYDTGKLPQRTLLCSVLVVILYILALPIPFNWLIGWLIALGVFAFFHYQRHAAWPRFLVWCGIVSYSLYLLHALPLYWLGAWGAPIALIIAGVSYRLLEHPMIQFGRSLDHAIFQAPPRLPTIPSINGADHE
jgi:peptidoglycan/LPS O-acetylase OafA/YrhL